MKFTKLFLTLIFLSTTPLTFAASPVLDLKLDQVFSFSRFDLAKLKSKNVALVFMRERCSSCEAQMKEWAAVSEAEKEKLNLEIVLVVMGFVSDEIKRDIRHAKWNHVSVIASTPVLKLVGDVNLSPTTVLFLKDSALEKEDFRWNGKISFEKVARVLKRD